MISDIPGSHPVLGEIGAPLKKEKRAWCREKYGKYWYAKPGEETHDQKTATIRIDEARAALEAGESAPSCPVAKKKQRSSPKVAVDVTFHTKMIVTGDPDQVDSYHYDPPIPLLAGIWSGVSDITIGYVDPCAPVNMCAHIGGHAGGTMTLAPSFSQSLRMLVAEFKPTPQKGRLAIRIPKEFHTEVSEEVIEYCRHNSLYLVLIDSVDGSF